MPPRPRGEVKGMMERHRVCAVVLAVILLASIGCDGGGVSEPADAASADVPVNGDGGSLHDGGPHTDAGDIDSGLGDAGGRADVSGGVAPASTLVCEVAERPGPIPQPPGTFVSDFGAPVRLPDSVNDPCPNDAVEVSADGKRIYYSYSVNALDLLVKENRAAKGTEVRFQDVLEDGTWGAPRTFDLRKGDPDALPGETRVAKDGSWVIWHALSPKDYGYVRGLPAGQDFDLDLFEAAVEDDVPGPGVHIGPEVNSEYLEGEQWATDDGRTIYFASNRPGGFGGVKTTDIWGPTAPGSISPPTAAAQAQSGASGPPEGRRFPESPSS